MVEFRAPVSVPSIRVVVLSLLLVVTGNTIKAWAETHRRTGAQTELTTTTGDHLTGIALRFDCHGLSLIYFGNSLRIPVSKLSSLISEGEVAVYPGTGKDQITGTLTVTGGTVSVTSRDLGRVELPIAAFRCNGKAPAETASVESDVPKPGVRSSSDGGEQIESAAVTRSSIVDLQASGRKMTSVTGKGPASSDQNPAGPSSVSKTGQTVTPEPASTFQRDTTDSQNESPGIGSDTMAPIAPGNPPTPKEQQEQSERNTLEFLRNEVVLVQPHKIEADFSVSYLHTSQQIGNERVVVGNALGRYGFFEGFEGFLAIPYVWGQRQTNALSGTINNEMAGIGDIRFGAKYNIIQESQGIPVVVVGASSVAPTGHNPYAPPLSTPLVVQSDIRDPVSIQIGTGHWQLIGSMTALKSNDPLVLYASINYTHFIPATYYGVQIVPGDIWELNSGLGFSINDTATIGAQVFIDYVKKWAFNNVSIPQTGITPISLKLSYTHILSPFDILQPSIIFGVTRDATDAVVSVDYIHRF